MLARCVRSSFCAALFIALSAITAAAQKTINVPADQPTIQAGINAAVTGDTVLVAPGTYLENIDFKGKAITVTSSGGAAKTVIDGGNKNPAVIFQTSEPRAAVLSNFTVTHGSPFTDFSHGGYTGGGVFISNSQPTILNNVITQNYCQNVYSTSAAPLLQGNTISSSITPEKCFVLYTGGIMLRGDLQGSSNQPPQPAVVIGNTIENNTTGQSGDGGGDGGPGIAIWGGSPIIRNNTIRNNLSRSGSGGGINVVYGTGISIIQNLIYGNTAGCGGGAIGSQMGSLGPDTYLLIANNTMVGNIGGNSGGYSDCRKSSEVWTAFYSGGGPSIKFVNNIFDANATPALDCGSLQGSFFGSIDEAHQSLFDHNLLYDAAGNFFAANCADTSHLHGNLVADPQFINPAANDFHLKATSPAIDTGNGSVLQNLKLLSGVSLTSDFDGNPRELDATGKGSPVIDMGAYEFGGIANGSPTRVVLSSSAYSGAAGNNFTLTASLSSALGVPTGAVTFFSDGVQIGVANAANGVAVLTNVAFAPGAHILLATYAGQGSFPAAVSVVVILYLDRYIGTISFSSSPNPSLLGQSVTFTAKVSEPDHSIPSPVLLYDNTSGSTLLATLTPDASGTATFSTSSLSVGFHYISASYAGDAQHASFSASISQQVTNGYATSITLSSSRNPSLVGQSTTFTATVTSTNGTPAGSIQFTDNGAALATQLLDASGHATLSTSALTAGDHNITATLVPTGSFAGSSATLFQTVTAITNSVALSSSANPSAYGQTVTVTAHVASNAGNTPSGSVVFYEGTLYLGTQAINATGDAAVTLTNSNADLSVGGHLITASFTATGTSSAVSASYTQQVDGLPTSTLLAASPTTGVGGVTPITLSATAASATPGGATPTGSLIFYLNGAQLAAVSLVNGVATYTGTLPAGVNQLYAAYIGAPAGIYAGSNSNTVTVTLSVPPSTLNLISAANPAPAATPVTFTAQLLTAPNQAALAGQPVVFTIDGAPAGTITTNSQGLASITTQTLLPGAHVVTAAFAGSLSSGPATAPALTEQINANTTTTVLLGPPGPVYQNSRIGLGVSVVAGFRLVNPTGTATVYEGAVPLLTGTLTPTSGSPSFLSLQVPPLSVGTHILYAVYTSDSPAFLPSQSPAITITVLPQDFAITLADPTLTIQTGHHHLTTVSLTSTGGLAGTLTHVCGLLPVYTTCAWSKSTDDLPANGTVSTGLTIDTNQLPGFIASSARPGNATTQGAPFMARTLRHEWAATTLALSLLLPLFSRKHRKHLPRLLSLLFLAALATTLTACGADKYPGSTPPGTYTIPITATMAVTPGGQPITHSVNLTLVVTQ